MTQELNDRLRNKKDIFKQATKMPLYPGGEKAIENILDKNFKNVFLLSHEIPKGSFTYDYIEFVVESDGSVTFPALNVNRISDYELYLKVFNKLGKWMPGSNSGKPVAVKMEIQFKRK